MGLFLRTSYWFYDNHMVEYFRWAWLYIWKSFDAERQQSISEICRKSTKRQQKAKSSVYFCKRIRSTDFNLFPTRRTNTWRAFYKMSRWGEGRFSSTLVRLGISSKRVCTGRKVIYVNSIQYHLIFFHAIVNCVHIEAKRLLLNSTSWFNSIIAFIWIKIKNPSTDREPNGTNRRTENKFISRINLPSRGLISVTQQICACSR